MKQLLHQNWQLRRTDTAEWLPAQVPGTVYTDLLRLGKMDDPFWKTNEDAACALMEYDYEYVCRFEAQPELRDCERVLLRFDGLDTVADISLNGEALGRAHNMHRVWEFDVTALLAPQNELRVVLRSPLRYIAEADKKFHTHGNEDTYAGFMHLRKAHCMFGWDWGAHLPDAGIFRAVSLVGIHTARIDNVYVPQRHKNGEVTLLPRVEVNTAGLWNYPLACENAAELHCAAVLTAPDGTQTAYDPMPEKIRIANPQLWWPNGLGAQPLYTLRVTLMDGEEPLDVWERRIGLRTLTVRREKDEWGESFAHEVNGHTVFAMGADYIPEDHLLGRVTPQKTRALLQDCKDANFNCVRVWGGGYYPDDGFYDACDEMGLLVWQDFMFACSVYELTEEFEADIRAEFADNIKRLRGHASLALWCGNNEMEMFVKNGTWVTKPSEVRDYLFMYERIIPAELRRYDPETFYWPASPSSGGSFDEPNSPDRGDVHYWEVWHGCKPFTDYRKHFFRYASEFGFQSFPCVSTWKTVTDDEADLNPFSYVTEMHQRSVGSSGKMMNYMQQTYRYPYDFDSFTYATQLMQADAIRYGVEHFRRNRGRCMGAIYWQLNDCWPVISWSSIDYCGRWKALHYYAKRFFAPVMVSCEEEGMLTMDIPLTEQHPPIAKSIRLNVANETLQPQTVRVEWALRNADAAPVQTGVAEVRVDALSAVWLDKIDLPQADLFRQYVSYSCSIGGQEVSSGTVIFSYPKYFAYQNPHLAVRTEGNEIIVTADAFAKSVEIRNDNEDLVLSDNYFDMNAGEKRVTVLRGSAQNLRVRSVYDIG